MTNQRIFDAEARHQVYLQRLANGKIKGLSEFLTILRMSILDQLDDNINNLSRTSLNARLAAINNIQRDLFTNYIDQLNLDLEQLALSESKFEQNLLGRILKTDMAALSEAALFGAINSSPLAGNNRSGKLLKVFISDWSKSQRDMLTGIIRQGYAEGISPTQVRAGIRSAIQGQTKRSAEAIVRTSFNHISQQAKVANWNNNSDLIKYWKFVAVLDSRTTVICANIASANKVYKIGKGPTPPRHVNCRSTQMAVLNKNDNIDDMNYYDWLKTQPDSFVFDTIGRKRGELLLSDKLTSEEFAKFGMNKRFEPLTLAEMEEKDKTLNLDLFPDD